MSMVQLKTQGRVRVLAVDITADANGWEHACSTQIIADAVALGVPVVGSQVHQANDIGSFQQVFEDVGDDFTVLLLFGHGNAGTGGAAATMKLGTDLDMNYYLLQAVPMNLSDKVVVLCVCEGFCQDAIDTFVKGEHFALMLVAPDKPLSRQEAEAFFPVFLAEVNAHSYESIDPSIVDMVLGEQNHHANGKMRLHSGVGV
jgi:hypothetical protein